LEKLGDLRAEIYDFRDNVYETIESIKPYKNRQNLKYEQELRKDWMEEITDKLNELLDEMNSAEWELEDK
jgi:Mg2+ and Co2+ transporter CorA